jgi:hypothetical protein
MVMSERLVQRGRLFGSMKRSARENRRVDGASGVNKVLVRCSSGVVVVGEV